MSMKIKKGDSVRIVVGKDRGKTGKVLRVFPESRKILVEGMNIVKKHARPRKQGEKGEMVSVARPMQSSNVRIMCGNCGKGVTAGFLVHSDKKVRICKECKQEL